MSFTNIYFKSKQNELQNEQDLVKLSNRMGHVAIMHDKYMLVWGGNEDEESMDTNLIWLFDTQTEKWSSIVYEDDSDDSPLNISGSFSIKLDNNLYIFGGTKLTKYLFSKT